MKFDVAFSNPPYDGDLHLKLIDRLTEFSSIVVAVHPARWFEDVIAELKNGSALGRKYRGLKLLLSSVILFPFDRVNRFFNIELCQDLMVGVYLGGDARESILASDIRPEDDRDALFDMLMRVKGIYKCQETFFSVLSKILAMAEKDSFADHVDENRVDGIRVQVKGVVPKSGGPGCQSETARMFNTDIVGRAVCFDGRSIDDGEWWSNAGGIHKSGYQKKEGEPFPLSIRFDSVEDARWFIIAWRGTNTARNVVHMLKYGPSVPLKHIPYFDGSLGQHHVFECLELDKSDSGAMWITRSVPDYRIKDFIRYGEWIGLR